MVRLEAAAATRRDSWVMPQVLAVLTLLVSPDLMSTYSEINPFDEAKYIESGRLLLIGWRPTTYRFSSGRWFARQSRSGS